MKIENVKMAFMLISEITTLSERKKNIRNKFDEIFKKHFSDSYTDLLDHCKISVDEFYENKINELNNRLVQIGVEPIEK